MKVKELIDKLKDMPQEEEVYYLDNEYGETEVDNIYFSSSFQLFSQDLNDNEPRSGVIIC